jgi:hypothetical protein
MLYPLSYEGLRCSFAQRVGKFRAVVLGLATSRPTACAASVPRAVWPASNLPPRHAALIVRMVVGVVRAGRRGGDGRSNAHGRDWKTGRRSAV